MAEPGSEFAVFVQQRRGRLRQRTLGLVDPQTENGSGAEAGQYENTVGRTPFLLKPVPFLPSNRSSPMMPRAYCKRTGPRYACDYT
jgi:hypothetical protein